MHSIDFFVLIMLEIGHFNTVLCISSLSLFSLEEEQAQVEKEYSRQPKREELEQHIRDLTRQGEDLSSEIEKVNGTLNYWTTGF